MWAVERERVYEFGQVIETLSSGTGVIYLFPFPREFCQLDTERPVALESFTPGETREFSHCGCHTAKRKTKQRVIFASL